MAKKKKSFGSILAKTCLVGFSLGASLIKLVTKNLKYKKIGTNPYDNWKPGK